MNPMPQHIAVVEDDLNMRTLLKDFLISQGYSVSCFSSCSDVMKAVGVQTGPATIDAVVTDIAMPGMSGIELLKSLRKDHPGIPCILITAFGTPQGYREARTLGAAEYLTKPFQLNSLANALQLSLPKKH